jgi:FkbM family methyltransferase
MPIPIITGPLKGLLWITGAAAGEANGLSVLFNLSEKKQMMLAKKEIKKDDVCFDIGANVGLYTLLFANYGKVVYAFEPNPRNLCYLYKTISKNCIDNGHIIPCAVSDSNGLTFFRHGENNATGKIDKNGEVPVPKITIDYFIERTQFIPSLIKIDVEGAELLVLNGAIRCISIYKPKILISIHSNELRNECLKFFRDFQYQIFPIDHEDVEKAWEYFFDPDL